MQLIMTIFGWPLGFLMLGCYMVTGNRYALAIVLFTVVTRILLLPFSIKQQKETAKTQLFQPKLEAIQKKYGNNKERYNEEVQKLYTEEGFNPLSGCLPALLQFPFLFGIMDVVYKPIYHILRASTAVINEMATVATAAGFDMGTSYYTQLNLMKAVKEAPEVFSSFDQELVSKIANFDMSLLGLDLSVTPQFKFMLDGSFNWYLIIPILCGVFQILQSLYSMLKQDNGAAKGTMLGMMLMMPLFSIYICFIVPAGVGFYWTVSAVVMLIQTVFLNIFYDPKKIAEKISAEMEAEKEARKQKRIEARERLKELQNAKGEKAAKKEYAEENPSQKEANRKKLAEARKRMAEKYGEEYEETNDDDLK